METEAGDQGGGEGLGGAMRDIKFRAIIEGTMYFDVYVGENRMVQLDHQTVALYGSTKGVMQYTGLKDKNGVEIYEGDIVSVVYATWDEDVLPEIRAVKDIRKDYLWLNSHTLTIKVIGNIYENPELLND